MDLRLAIEAAALTAIYPSQGQFDGLQYCATGLAGEIGEIYNKLKKCMRTGWLISDEKREEMGAEIGGALWYALQIFRELEGCVCESEKVLLLPIDQLQGRICNPESWTSFEDAFPCPLKQVNVGLTVATTASHGICTLLIQCEDKRVKECTSWETGGVYGRTVFERNLQVLAGLCMVATSLGFKLSEILEANLALLAARSEKGTLMGDGDGIDGGSRTVG
ncbi:hypothetical protein KAR91_38625 [Candidatus Pacearchaeota archaeon]|nr:hypothetical protein [Candidatus Pacearchaeota archaeon]